MDNTTDLTIAANNVPVPTLPTIRQGLAGIIDFNTRDGFKMLFNAQNDALSLAEDAPEVIQVVGIDVAPVPSVDEVTGETTEKLRTIIIDAKGNAYVSMSWGIGRDCAALAAIPGLWEDMTQPLEISVVSQKRNGKTYKHVVMV